MFERPNRDFSTDIETFQSGGGISESWNIVT